MDYMTIKKIKRN